MYAAANFSYTFQLRIFLEYQVCPCYISGLTGRKGGSSLIKIFNFQSNKTKPNRWRVCFPVNNVFNCKAQTGKHSLTPTSMCSASLLRFALLCQKALETDSPCKIHTGPDRIVWLQLSVCSCYSCSWIGSVESRNSLTGLPYQFMAAQTKPGWKINTVLFIYLEAKVYTVSIRVFSCSKNKQKNEHINNFTFTFVLF